MSFIKEYREFAIKGNVVDMAVGIIIGAAFTAIVNSLVADIINPVIGVVTGGVDFADLYVNLGPGEFASLAQAEEAGAPTVNYGLFINAVLSFLIVSFAVFLIIHNLNRLKRQEEEPAEPATAEASEEVQLLRDIRDALTATPGRQG